MINGGPKEGFNGAADESPDGGRNRAAADETYPTTEDGSKSTHDSGGLSLPPSGPSRAARNVPEVSVNRGTVVYKVKRNRATERPKL